MLISQENNYTIFFYLDIDLLHKRANIRQKLIILPKINLL